MTRKVLITKIKNYFTNKTQLTAVYLFGSYARGEEKKDSDIDLAILFEQNPDDYISLITEYEIDLGRVLSKKVEIQKLNNTDVEFAKRVYDEGILIIDKNPKIRVSEEIKIFSKYFDMLPLYKEYYNILRQQSLKGDFHA